MENSNTLKNNNFQRQLIRTENQREIIIYKDLGESYVLPRLLNQDDVNSQRVKKLLNLPDLARKENSPVKFVVDKILDLPRFKDFDVLTIPETITVENNFDKFNFPKNHPSRKETDTYFISADRVLRTQTTSAWLYYLNDENIIGKLRSRGCIGALSFGKVYRKDEIDRHHYPVFHQIDGFYICEKKQKVFNTDDLADILVDIAEAIYGSDIKTKVFGDEFPYTDPSIQMEIEWNDKWLEVLGAGIIRPSVLPNFNLSPEKYNGWAFGFGVDRLAMIKMSIPDIRILWSDDQRITKQFKNLDCQYHEVSKFPPINRDISFILNADTSLNKFYEIVRDLAKDLTEEVKMIDRYDNESKFGKNKISYTFRITYRSPERTLTDKEVNDIQEKIRKITEQELEAVLR